VAKILSDSDYTVICAFITPFRSIRSAVRGLFINDEYVEVFLDCPVEVCEQRDPKGLYSRAKRGEIPEFTGVSSPFEVPENSDLIICTSKMSCEESLLEVIEYLESRFPDTRPDAPRVPGALRRARPKMAIIGLDCAAPSLVFGRDDLPTLRALMEHGQWGACGQRILPLLCCLDDHYHGERSGESWDCTVFGTGSIMAMAI